MSLARRRRSRGQGLTEFAMASPLILLLFVALFDVGRVVFSYTTLTNATRAGARVAMVNQSNSVDCSGTEQPFKCVVAHEAVGSGIDPAEVADVVVTGSNCLEMGMCTVTVAVSHRVDLIVGALLQDVLGVGGFDLSTSTTMPIERVYSMP